MKGLVLEERKKNLNYAPCLELLDDVTDYEYDIQGWVEDCLDEIDMSGDFETVLKMCEDLLTIFAWLGYTGSNIKFRKVATLGVLGRKDEVQEYSKNWLQEEPQNIMAATAGVYVNMDARNWEEAEALVKRFIKKDTKCTPENDSMFVAASRLYQLMGKKREQKKVEKEMNGIGVVQAITDRVRAEIVLSYDNIDGTRCQTVGKRVMSQREAAIEAVKSRFILDRDFLYNLAKTFISCKKHSRGNP